MMLSKIANDNNHNKNKNEVRGLRDRGREVGGERIKNRKDTCVIYM